MPKPLLRVGMTLFAAVALFASASALPSYPNHAIRIVVPFPAGGLNDSVMRVIQPSLQDELGQPIVIENRTGASGIVGTDFVAKSPPDGYTLLVVASSHTVLPATNAKLSYDAEHDFAPVSILARDPLLFVVNNSVPARTLPDFIALAKSRPTKLNYATPGSASQAHLVTELLCQRAGIDMLEVSYRGGAPAVLALVSGEVQFAVLSAQLSAPQIQSGAIRVIASGGATRDLHFPNVPTLDESGFHGMQALQWVGMLAPAGTPKDAIGRLNGALQRILTKPDIVAALAAQGVTAAASSPESFGSLISAEISAWQEVAKRAALLPQ